MSSSIKWFNGLQVLRGLLFIMVFVSHSGHFIKVFGNLGGMGVSAFFVLSGFLLQYKTNESSKLGGGNASFHNVIHFVKKFYPLYFVFLLIAVLINSGSSTKLDFIKCLFLIQSYFGNAKTALAFNWPTWFMSSAMICYFFSPFIGRVIKLIKCNIKLLIGLMAFCIALIILWNYQWRSVPEPYGKGYYYVYIFPLARLLDFIIGSVLGEIYKSYGNWINDNCFANKHDYIEVLVFLAFLGMQIYNKFAPKIMIYTVLWLPISLGLIWIFANEKGFISRYLCKSQVLLWLGSISFELYICHRMVLLFFQKYVGNSVMLWIYSIITTLVIAQFFSCIKKENRRIV